MMERLFFTSLFIFSSSCVEFNSCELPKSSVIGFSEHTFDIRSSLVRRSECPIGNLVADSIFHYAKRACKEDPKIPCPDLALIPAGSIREETVCKTRASLPAGPIYASDIEQLLPFQNEIIMVRLSQDDLKLALERSVSGLGLPGKAGEKPHFLHASGLSFDVDCKNQPLVLSANGLKVIKAGNRVGAWSLNPRSMYNVATLSYVAEGNDGFIAFLQRDSNNQAISGKNQKTLPKYNPAHDVIRNNQNQTVYYRQALIDWIQEKQKSGLHLQAGELGRIHLDESCQ